MFPIGCKAQYTYAEMVDMRLIFGRACESKRDACPLYQEFFVCVSSKCGPKHLFSALDGRLMANASKRRWAFTNSGNALGKKEESLMWFLQIQLRAERKCPDMWQ